MDFHKTVEHIVDGLEACAVVVIVLGIAGVTVAFAGKLARRQDLVDAYSAYRRGLGRVILLGLEFLIAADILATVAVSFSPEAVATLGVVVAIRTVLAFTLELDISGRWPWQRAQHEGAHRT